jgi:hypothetical protein
VACGGKDGADGVADSLVERESRLVRSETDFRKNHALIQSLRVSLSRFFDSKKTGQTLKELDALYQPVA